MLSLNCSVVSVSSINCANYVWLTIYTFLFRRVCFDLYVITWGRYEICKWGIMKSRHPSKFCWCDWIKAFIQKSQTYKAGESTWADSVQVIDCVLPAVLPDVVYKTFYTKFSKLCLGIYSLHTRLLNI